MMKTATALFSLSLLLVGCDVPKSVGDEPVEDDAQESSSTTTTTGDPSASDSATSTSGSPTAGGGATTTPADTDTAGNVCADFDEGPYDGVGEYEWACLCTSCDLEFPDVPPETIDLFEGSGGGLCDCLCAQAGCGPTQGEGGVGTGADTEWGDTDSGDTEWGGSSTTSPPDTDSAGETSEGFPDSDSDTTE